MTSAIYYHVQTTPFQRSQHHLAFSVVAPFRKVTVPKADTRGAPRLLGLVIVFEVSSIAYSWADKFPPFYLQLAGIFEPQVRYLARAKCKVSDRWNGCMINVSTHGRKQVSLLAFDAGFHTLIRSVQDEKSVPEVLQLFLLFLAFLFDEKNVRSGWNFHENALRLKSYAFSWKMLGTDAHTGGSRESEAGEERESVCICFPLYVLL